MPTTKRSNNHRRAFWIDCSTEMEINDQLLNQKYYILYFKIIDKKLFFNCSFL